MSGDRCAQAIAAQRPGHALSREFYCDADVFESEVHRLLLRHWHCAGHQSQVPEPGDFFTIDICGESLIIVCAQDRRVRALHNVCRHRGSHVCTEPAGHARGGVFVCPYHAWTYGLDGCLRAARHMPAGFDRTAYGLKPLHTKVMEGLIFVSFAETPLGLEHVEAALAGSARIYGWAQAKVAHSFLAYPDHGLIYRFIPRTVQRTDMEVIWLVRDDARSGVDYDLERLTWLWKVTSVADKRIIELNQQGINSRFYEPGPYSPMEQHTRRFVEWVLAELR
jgi:phenylpropionate dioxygenase-like ring-hydroxylating dioxygenase large terminal subunit